MRGGPVLLVSLLLAAPGTAHAGRTFYGWLYGTEVMPERGAELQTWIAEENDKPAEHSFESNWLVSPLIGVTDQLEIALPVEIQWEKSNVDRPHTAFDKFGIEARYRLVTQDPVDAPPFVPLIRVAVKRLVGTRDGVRPEADFVASYEMGRVHVLADLGMIGEIDPNTKHFEVRPGAGVSIQAVGDLRFGAEVYSELSLDTHGDSWAIVGPDMSWTHGRFWISAMYGIGVYDISNAPRVQWGIAF